MKEKINKNLANNDPSDRRDCLAINEKLFRALVEHSSAGVLIIDKKGKISFAGPSTENLLGYSPEEVRGRHVFEFLHKDDRMKAMKRLTTLVGRYGSQTTSEYRIFHKDGSLRWLEVTGTNLFKNEAVKGIILNYRDITDEKNARDRTKNLIAMVESSDDAIIGKKLDGTITFWNKGAEIIYGFKKDEVVGKKIFDIIPEEKHEEERQFLEEIKKGNEIRHRATTRKKRDGSLIDVSITVSPVKDERGNIIATSTIARDVSEKRLMERRERFLSQATTTLSSSLDYRKILKDLAQISVPAMGDWCVVNIMNNKGYLDRVIVAHKDEDKEKYAKILEKKYPPDPEIDAGIYKVVRSGEGSLYANVTDEMIKKMARDKEHEKIVRKLGISSSIAVPIKSRGKIIGAISFIKNSKDNPYTEDDLSFAQELGARVGFAVDNAILYHNLDNANRMKDAFLASLAHELRNPLAPIVSSLELMRMEDVKNKEITQGIDTIERHVKNTTHLLDDLLDISRVNQGVLELNKRTADIKDIVSNAIETSSPFMKEGGHNLKTHIPGDSIYANIDPIRMEQALVNLLNNAARYTPEGGKIDLSYHKDGEYVVFSVKDNGKGIHQEFMPYIFDMFMQADKRLNRNTQGGLGIGLSLVKTIVEMHGGSITAHSDGVGRGSEFILRIPTGVSEVDKNKKEDDNCVLIVDDNIDAANSLAKLLTRSGHNVTVVHNGLDAISSIENSKPCAILLDIGLPQIDGYEVAKRVRMTEAGKDILLIAITGYGQDSDKEKAKKAGFDYHVTKPVSVDELCDLLDQKYKDI